MSAGRWGIARWIEQTIKEAEMEHRRVDQEDERDDGYPSEAHRLLGLTHEELLADMAARGETVEGALAAFDRVLARARAFKVAPAPEASPMLDEEGEAPAIYGSIAFYDERVAAGTGFAAQDDPRRRSATLADFFGKQNWASVIVAPVSGWSMRGDSIRDGDSVLVDTSKEARDGDIVLAHLAGRGQLVKRLRLCGVQGVELVSANDEFAPIAVGDLSALTIHGVVVGRAGKL